MYLETYMYIHIYIYAKVNLQEAPLNPSLALPLHFTRPLQRKLPAHKIAVKLFALATHTHPLIFVLLLQETTPTPSLLKIPTHVHEFVYHVLQQKILKK